MMFCAACFRGHHVGGSVAATGKEALATFKQADGLHPHTTQVPLLTYA